jgi:hypothetical protein
MGELVGVCGAAVEVGEVVGVCWFGSVLLGKILITAAATCPGNSTTSFWWLFLASCCCHSNKPLNRTHPLKTEILWRFLGFEIGNANWTNPITAGIATTAKSSHTESTLNLLV